MKQQTLVLAVCSFIAFGLPAQNKFEPKLFTVKDGLPNSYLFTVSQDSKGSLWVGSSQGLSRFDGRSFISMGFHNGLTNLSFDAIFEEPDSSRIWLGSRNGLFLLQNNIAKQINTSDSLPIIFVYKIQKSQKNQIWAVTDKGVYHLTSRVARKILFPGFENLAFRQVIETDKGTYLNVQSELSQIFFLDQQGNHSQVMPSIPNERFVNILRVTKKSMIIQTESSIYKISEDKTEKLFVERLKKKSLYACFYDSKGRLWVSTGQDGILVAEPEIESDFAHQIEIESPFKIVSSFFEDQDGNMWGASSDGLLKISGLNYRIFTERENRFINRIQQIFLDRQGNIILSGYLGLAKLEGGYFNPISITSKGSLQRNLRESIDAWCFDEKNDLWFLTRQGIFGKVSSGESTKIGSRNYLKGYQDIRFQYDEFRKRVWLPSNELLLGGENGVAVFKSANNITIRSPLLIIPFHNGNVLVKTESDELFLIDSKNRAESIKSSRELDIKRIINIYKDPLENLWAYYLGGGLIKCRISNKELIKELEVSIEHGLPSNTIESVTFDNQNRIWIATHGGLSVVDWSKEHSDAPMIYPLDIELNLPVKNWGGTRLQTDREGNIWLAARDRVICIFTDKINFNRRPPTVTIENIQLNSGDIRTDSTFKYQEVGSVFRHNQNSMTISFNGVSLMNPKILYSYKLQGLHDAWIEGDNNAITFVKLTPGRYEFMVRARNTDTLWSKPATISFTILSPFWQQWWFASLCVVSFLLVAYGLHTYRMQQVLKIERVRLKIAQDLHDDIGSSLSSFSFYIESIRKQNKEFNPQVQHILDQIGKTANHVIFTLSDIVWAVNPAKDDVESLVKRMNSYASELCELKNILLEFQDEFKLENSKLKIEERKNLYLIFKEALNNAIKHSQCSKIRITLNAFGNGLEMIITDNGKGFQTQLDYDGNGLKNMIQRSSEIQYKFDITSEVGKGSQITVSSFF